MVEQAVNSQVVQQLAEWATVPVEDQTSYEVRQVVCIAAYSRGFLWESYRRLVIDNLTDIF